MIVATNAPGNDEQRRERDRDVLQQSVKDTVADPTPRRSAAASGRSDLRRCPPPAGLLSHWTARDDALGVLVRAEARRLRHTGGRRPGRPRSTVRTTSHRTRLNRRSKRAAPVMRAMSAVVKETVASRPPSTGPICGPRSAETAQRSSPHGAPIKCPRVAAMGPSIGLAGSMGRQRERPRERPATASSSSISSRPATTRLASKTAA